MVICHENRADLIAQQRNEKVDSKNDNNSDENNNNENNNESKDNESKNDESKANDSKENNFYVSTPFHVRFGKFSVLRPNKIPVCVRVNGKINYDIAMRLNDKGIAEFVDPKSVDLTFVDENENKNKNKNGSSGSKKNGKASDDNSTTMNESKNNDTNTSNAASDKQADTEKDKDKDKAQETGGRVRKRDRLYNYLFGSGGTDDNANDTTTTVTESTNDASNDKNDDGSNRIRKRDRLMAFVQSSVQSGMSYYYSEDNNENNEDDDGVEIIATKHGGGVGGKDASPSLSDMYSLYNKPVNNVPTSDILSKLNLKKGLNKIEFIIPVINGHGKREKGLRINECNIFLWNNNLKIVISDVDGTITRSDVRGHLMSSIGYDWMHPGVIELFNKISANGYQLVYLSARSIGQADTTRHYLFEMCSHQNGDEILKFPQGPVLLSPTTTRQALYREVIQKRPQDFKIPTLMHLFYAMTLHDGSKDKDKDNDKSKDGKDDKEAKDSGDNMPFFGGFGNRVTDVASYDGVNVDHKNIYIITDEYKKIEQNAKKQVWLKKANYVEKYQEILDKVDQLFPPLNSSD